jgi:hypothetical protein
MLVEVLQWLVIAYTLWCIGKQGDQITRLRGVVFGENPEMIAEE